MSKIIQIFLIFFSSKNINLGACFFLLTFFENFNLENTLFNKIMLMFRSLDLDVDLTKIFFWKSAIYHSIKLPFDAKVAEKNLKYYLLSNQLKVGKLLPKKQPIFFLNFHLLIILIKNSCRIHKKVWYIWQNLWIFLIIYLKFVLFFLYFPPI